MKTTRHQKTLGVLPSNYIRHRTINHFYPSCGAAIINWIFMMVAIAIWGLIYLSFIPASDKPEVAFPYNKDTTALVVVIVGVFSYLIHELVHYLVSKWFGAHPKWGGRNDETLSYYQKKWLPKFTASIWSSFVYSKAQYLYVILSPLVLLNTVYFILITTLPVSVLTGYLVFAGVLNGVFSVLDVFLATLVLFSPPLAYFQDESNGLVVYIPSNQL